MNRRIQSVKMMHAGRVWASACAMWIGLAVALPLAASTAQIATSQKTYSVGEGMVVYGTGFSPSVTITLSVVRPDKLTDYVPGVTTDTGGSFTASYTPPLEPGRYNFTATDGANSANTATTGADAFGYNKGVYNKADNTAAGGAGTWTTGNAGSHYLENQWAFYQYQVTGITSTLPDFDIAFNHLDSSGTPEAVFVDAFANFRACLDCLDSTNPSGPSQGMLVDGLPYPPSGVPSATCTSKSSTGATLPCGWIDAHEAMSLINYPFTTTCQSTPDPANTPSANHCFHVNGDTVTPNPAGGFGGTMTLHALLKAAYNIQVQTTGCETGTGTTCVDPFTATPGPHTVTIFYEAHLASSLVWLKGMEARLGCGTDDVNGHIDYVFPGSEVVPPKTVYGTDAYNPHNTNLNGENGVTDGSGCTTPPPPPGGNGWDTSIYGGIAYAAGSSRHFNIENQPSGGSQGGLTLPIPGVPSPTGSITIIKATVPTPAAGAFGFTGDLGSFTLGTDGLNPNSKTVSGLSGGLTYNVAETGLTGWNLTSLSCTGSGSTFVYTPSTLPAASGGVAITLSTSNNASVTCTFTNTGSANLVIVKDTVGGTTGAGNDTFNYTGSGSGVTNPFSLMVPASGTSQIAFNNIVPGSKSVTEQVPAGWDLTGLSCVSTNGTSSITSTATLPVIGSASAGVSGTLAAGDTVTCTFTNTKEATLAIQKHTVGGTGSFSFTTSGSGAAGFTNGFSRDTSGANPTTSPAFSFTAAQFGAKTVQETIPAGWNLTNITCTAGSATILFGTGGAAFTAGSTPSVFQAGDDTVKVTVAAGNTPSCTFENTRQASIVIRKQTVGGTGTFTYATDLTGGSPSAVAAGSFSITTVSPSTFVAETFSNATPGSHSVTETLPSGWSLTSLSCTVTGTNGSTGAHDGGNPLKADITLNAGDTVTCDYTNSKDATIVLVKNTVGGNGTFAFTATGTGLSGTTFTTANGTGSHTYSNIVPGSGTWSFAEVVPIGWTGNTTNVGCVANPSAGTTISGGTGGVVGAGGTVTSPSITTIAPGATVTCTFYNSANATIVLVKNTVGGNGTFTFTASGAGLPDTSLNPISLVTSGTAAGGTAKATYSNISPGTGSWSFTETVPTGWEGNTTAVTCSVTTTGTGGTTFGTAGTTGPVDPGNQVTSRQITALGAGDTVTCTFTNATIPTLTIVKNIHGTTPITFGYTVVGGDPLAASITISSGNTGSYGPVQIPSLKSDTISENTPLPSGWTLTDVSCTGYKGGGTGAGPLDSNGIPTSWNFIATWGDQVVCTYVNSNVMTTRTQGFWATHTGLANAVWGGNGTNYPSNGSGLPVINPADPTITGSPDSYLCGVQITALPAPNGENILMGGFWANISQKSVKGAKRTAVDQARMQMLQQYLAAVLNFYMWGAPVPNGGLSAARAAYCDPNATASSIQPWIGILGGYNSSGDSLPFTPGASATPQVSKVQADIDAWDKPTDPVD